MLLSVAEEMASYGYKYVAFPCDVITDPDTIESFMNSWDAMEHCYALTTDRDYFKSKTIDSLKNDLNIVMQSGIDLIAVRNWILLNLYDWKEKRKNYLKTT